MLDECGVDASNILMVTFTNKAANEILERVHKNIGKEKTNGIWIGTFHSNCIKILRTHGKLMGINNFTILDTKGQKDIIRDLAKNEYPSINNALVNHLLTIIGTYKNNMISPSMLSTFPDVDPIHLRIYSSYQNICWNRRTFDFDDLILYTILLLQRNQSVLDWCHDKFKYVMADEVQDTNQSQFLLLKLLCGPNNMFVIGDPNQSIYGFRNAKPEYLDNFANTHPNTIKLKLEKNYRSTTNILDAANAVIANNSFGTKVNMFSDNERGEKVKMYNAYTPQEEAAWIANEILCNPEKSFSDYAIIYRANYQSRYIEEALNKEGIGYVVFGGVSFYSRKEVKDMLAYLKLFVNDNDVDSFKRVLGTGTGVGETTITNIVNYALANNIHLKDCIGSYVVNTPNIRANTKKSLLDIAGIFADEYKYASDIIYSVYTHTDIRKSLVCVATEEAQEKIDILDEFLTMVRAMQDNNPGITLQQIVDDISLLTDAKGEEKSKANCVKLMTAHASKGLEFNTVFLTGAQEGSFPHKNSIEVGSRDAIEEERRLFYVAMTRAEKQLYITHVSTAKNGESGGYVNVASSRFLNEIPS